MCYKLKFYLSLGCLCLDIKMSNVSKTQNNYYILLYKNVKIYNYIIENLKIKNMPQLVPFYFINQVTFAFILLVIMIYVFSKYILPRFVRLFTTRLFISKL